VKFEAMTEIKIIAVGGGGFWAVLQVEALNHFLATFIAVLTIAALVPLAWSRWKTFIGENTLTKTGRILFVVLALLAICVWAAFVSGCNLAPRQLFTSSKFSAPGVTQSGPAASPGKVTTQNTLASVPLIPGAVITITTAGPKDGGRSGIASPAGTAPPSLTFSTALTAVETPTSYAPPAPPTPSELAKGEGVLIFYYVAAGLVLVAVVSAYLQHYKAALIFGAGAVIVPFLANFFASEWALRAAVGVVCAGGALIAAWHFVKNKLPSNS